MHLWPVLKNSRVTFHSTQTSTIKGEEHRKRMLCMERQNRETEKRLVRSGERSRES
jgi:hypothetical protein